MTTTTTIEFTPEEAWGYAAQWGLYRKSYEPGSCMYGFTKECRPQSEEHRQAVIDWMTKCRLAVTTSPSCYTPSCYDDNELDKIDSFIAFIKERGLAEDSFYIELAHETVTCCRLDGDEIDGQLRSDLLDCIKSGDVTEACKYVLRKWKPKFCIVKMVDGEYKNIEATYADKFAVYREIWFDHYTDEIDEDILDCSLIREAATHLESVDD